jgi:DNA-binding response OmpR family regulator
MMKVHIESTRPDYEVELAFDGESGLAAVNDMEPDMVILDINLPKKGGIELYKAISDKSGRSKVPVLVCTARGELGSFFEALDVAGFVDKPFEMEDLIRQIDRILSKEKQMIIFLLDQHTKPYISDVKNGLRRKGYKVIVVEI